jgi:hypothetical protein
VNGGDAKLVSRVCKPDKLLPPQKQLIKPDHQSKGSEFQIQSPAAAFSLYSTDSAAHLSWWCSYAQRFSVRPFLQQQLVALQVLVGRYWS